MNKNIWKHSIISVSLPAQANTHITGGHFRYRHMPAANTSREPDVPDSSASSMLCP